MMSGSTPSSIESSPIVESNDQITRPKSYAAATRDGASDEMVDELQAQSSSVRVSGQADDSTDQSAEICETFSGHGNDQGHRTPARNIHDSIALSRQNGRRAKPDPAETFIEPFKHGEDNRLVSVHSQSERLAHRSGIANSDNGRLLSGPKAARWERSHIHFAPLSMPLERRLQTLLVLIHTLSIVGMLAIFFFLCCIPLLWPIILPYTLYVLFSNAATSGSMSHRSNVLRGLSAWSLFASYFPARLHRSEELPATRKYIFGYHPHGIVSHGAFIAFATEALGFSKLFPGIVNTLLTLDSNFRIPLYRDYALALGLASVSRESCENLLSKGGYNGEGMGRAITIIIGGARESLDAQPRSLRLVLKRRKGFVKVAIRCGADLVPTIAFGENDLYDQVKPEQHTVILKIQLVIKKILGFTVPLFHARGVFNYDIGLMPYRRPVNIVTGRPILVQQSAKPDPEYIDEIHAKYLGELQRLWDDCKDDFAPERISELEFVE